MGVGWKKRNEKGKNSDLLKFVVGNTSDKKKSCTKEYFIFIFFFYYKFYKMQINARQLLVQYYKAFTKWMFWFKIQY